MNTIFTIPLIMLIVSALLIFGLFIYAIRIKNKSQLQKIFCLDLVAVLIISFGVILQSTLPILLNIPAIYFEDFIYIGTCFLPVVIFLTGLIFKKTKIQFNKFYYLLFVIPIISLIVLWTNNYHHLFYTNYSMNLSECRYGKYKIIHDIYSYVLLSLGIIQMLSATTKGSGFFSKQSLTIVLGMCIPIITNLLGTLQIIPMTVFITPISFTFTMLCFALAIFKFKFLGVSPIALNVIVNKISDSFIVLNEDYIITDYNQTFWETFDHEKMPIRNLSILDLIKKNLSTEIDYEKTCENLKNIKGTTNTVSFQQYFKCLQKYFTIEVTNLYNKDSFLGILILFKDITQHINDMQALKDNQDILMEKERLATLGQMIGGVAHNLKTPIMSIAGASEGLEDLVKEYEDSVGDPDVTIDDHHAIAHDMRDWISKIRSYDSYMSDIITAVKGQAVSMSENENDSFTLEDMLSRVNILMKHELKEALVTMTVDSKLPQSTKIDGNVNALVQVVNNLISNAIQSYGVVQMLGKSFANATNPGGVDNSQDVKIDEKTIDLIIDKKGDNIVISVTDHGCGMSAEVKDKLFKEMITTKGHNGSGLGLFMSYSTIKGNFKGDIQFTSEVGKGTTFNIILPRK